MLHRFVVRNLALFSAILFYFSNSFASPLGDKAYDYTSQILKFGPRPPASEGIAQVRKWIEKKVEEAGFKMETDRFTGKTPVGDLEMQNLSFVVPGKTNREIVLVAHYDSKHLSDFLLWGQMMLPLRLACF